jgi:hypothetical protein
MLKLKVQNIYTQLLLIVKISANKPGFEAAYLAESVNIAQAKSSQTAKFRPIWSHCNLNRDPTVWLDHPQLSLIKSLANSLIEEIGSYVLPVCTWYL